MKRKPTDCLVVRPNGSGYEYGVQRYVDPTKAKLKYGRGQQELTEFIKRGKASTLEEALKKNGMTTWSSACSGRSSVQ